MGGGGGICGCTMWGDGVEEVRSCGWMMLEAVVGGHCEQLVEEVGTFGRRRWRGCHSRETVPTILE